MRNSEKENVVDDIAKEFGLIKRGEYEYEYTLPDAEPTDFLIRYNYTNGTIECAEHIRNQIKSFLKETKPFKFGFSGIQTVTKRQARIVIMKIMEEYKQLLNDYKKKELEKDFE
jgi:hypothetical protein